MLVACSRAFFGDVPTYRNVENVRNNKNQNTVNRHNVRKEYKNSNAHQCNKHADFVKTVLPIDLNNPFSTEKECSNRNGSS